MLLKTIIGLGSLNILLKIEGDKGMGDATCKWIILHSL